MRKLLLSLVVVVVVAFPVLVLGGLGAPAGAATNETPGQLDLLGNAGACNVVVAVESVSYATANEGSILGAASAVGSNSTNANADFASWNGTAIGDASDPSATWSVVVEALYCNFYQQGALFRQYFNGSRAGGFGFGSFAYSASAGWFSVTLVNACDDGPSGDNDSCSYGVSPLLSSEITADGYPVNVSVTYAPDSIPGAPAEPQEYWGFGAVPMTPAPVPSVTCHYGAQGEGVVAFTTTASAAAVAGETYSYAWAFGDGATSSAGSSTSHTYTGQVSQWAADVKLTVTGDGSTYAVGPVVVDCPITVDMTAGATVGGGGSSSGSTGAGSTCNQGGWSSLLNPISDALCGLETFFVPSNAAVSSFLATFNGSSDAQGQAAPVSDWFTAVSVGFATVPSQVVGESQTYANYCTGGEEGTGLCACPVPTPNLGTAHALNLCQGLQNLRQSAGSNLTDLRDGLGAGLAVLQAFALFHVIRRSMYE